jgi:predicted NBD/HSP70 family sugar kinase
MNEVLAGIDIGGTKIAVALETPSGERVYAT